LDECIRVRLPNGALYRWRFEKGGQTAQIDVSGPYFGVVPMWPINSRIVFKSTPAIAKRDANVCRKSCQRTSTILALRTAGLNTRSRKFAGLIGVFPVVLRKTGEAAAW